MLISQGSLEYVKTIMSYTHIANFVNFIKKSCYAFKSIEKKSTTYKNFTRARAQVCHVHPTPMI